MAELTASENIIKAKVAKVKWRAVQFEVGTNVRWIDVMWGMDIWFGNVPFLKNLVLCNVLIWILMVIFLR